MAHQQILTSTASIFIKNALGYKQYASARPSVGSTYFAKTPFVRICSNAVVYKPKDSSPNYNVQTDIKNDISELITRINKEISHEIFFKQTINGPIFTLWHYENEDGTPNLSSVGTQHISKVAVGWTDIFTSTGSFDTLGDIEKSAVDGAYKSKLTLSMVLADQNTRITPDNYSKFGIDFGIEEFFEDATFTIRDFVNVLVLVQLSGIADRDFFKTVTRDKEVYYQIKVIPNSTAELGKKYKNNSSPLYFLLKKENVKNLFFRYDVSITDATTVELFNKIKFRYFSERTGVSVTTPPNFSDENLDFNSLLIEDNNLAKDNILQPITSLRTKVNNIDNYEIPGGIRAFEQDTSFEKSSIYGLGLRPKPGIISFEISTKGTLGALRKGKLNLKAFTMEQLETIQKLYMRPGTFLFIEWGWSVYPELKTTPLIDSDFENIKLRPNWFTFDFFNDKKTSPDEIRDAIIEMKKKSYGHYDATMAVVSNFNWTLTNNGDFDIAIEVTSHGNSLMGMIPTTSVQSIVYGELEPMGLFKELNKLKDTASDLNIDNKKYISLRTIISALSRDIIGVDRNAIGVNVRYSPNVTVDEDPITVLDIGDSGNFLSSIKPAKVIFLNHMNRQKFKKTDIPCFGASTYQPERHLSNIDLRDVVFIERDETLKETINTNSIDSFLKRLFSTIKDASADIIDLFYSINTLDETGLVDKGFETLSFVDGNSQDYTLLKKINHDEETNISNKESYTFSINSINSVVKDFSFSTRLPSAFQRAAFVSSTSLARATIGKQNSVDKMLQAFSGGYVNNFKKIGYTIGYDNNAYLAGQVGVMHEKVMYQKTYDDLMKGVAKLDDEKYLNEFRYYYYRKLWSVYDKKLEEATKTESPFFIPPVGINLSLTLDGMSGLNWGQLIVVDYLPLMLQDKSKSRIPIFYITEITEIINDSGWETKVNLVLRAFSK